MKRKEETKKKDRADPYGFEYKLNMKYHLHYGYRQIKMKMKRKHPAIGWSWCKGEKKDG